MKAYLFVADHLQVADGKLNGLGIGWTFIDPGPSRFFVGGYIEVPWSEANRQHHIELAFLDQDGRPVLNEEGNAVGMVGDLEVGRPPGHPAGAPFNVMLPPLPILGLPLAPASRYVWTLHIDGVTNEHWSVGFNTRPLPVPAT